MGCGLGSLSLDFLVVSFRRAYSPRPLEIVNRGRVLSPRVFFVLTTPPTQPSTFCLPFRMKPSLT